jgi:inosine/xanthosine triphosphatase
MQIIVGSTNPVKISAVKRVFSRFFPGETLKLENYDSPSNVTKQPIGLEIVINGAINRAENALTYFLKEREIPNQEERIFAIGIEAGLVSIPRTITGYLDFQYCAILDQYMHLSLGSGGGWEYPPNIIEMLKSDPDLEIGTIMAQISGDPETKYKNGAIGYYSQNKLTRPIITEQCVEMALIPYLNPELYFK